MNSAIYGVFLFVYAISPYGYVERVVPDTQTEFTSVELCKVTAKDVVKVEQEANPKRIDTLFVCWPSPWPVPQKVKEDGFPKIAEMFRTQISQQVVPQLLEKLNENDR